jgi:hypothetical protein
MPTGWYWWLMLVVDANWLVLMPDAGASWDRRFRLSAAESGRLFAL